VPISISIIGGISLKVISWLFKRVKAGISQPMKVLLQKDCENCEGKGYVLCKHCGGTGQVKKEVAYSGICKVCNGSGLVKTTCPTCYGNKTISRPLRFQIVSSESKVNGILFWPRTQTINIKVRNVDEKAGYFWAYVNLKDPSELSKKSEGVLITPGDIKDIKVSFPVDRWEGYNSTFDVQAEALPFTCPTCGGLGYSQRLCIACGGTGYITEKKQQIEVCPTCGGCKEILCEVCQGTGKIPRFG
jgi:DnaJ-class molecular chaperone